MLCLLHGKLGFNIQYWLTQLFHVEESQLWFGTKAYWASIVFREARNLTTVTIFGFDLKSKSWAYKDLNAGPFLGYSESFIWTDPGFLHLSLVVNFTCRRQFTKQRNRCRKCQRVLDVVIGVLMLYCQWIMIPVYIYIWKILRVQVQFETKKSISFNL